MDRYSDKLQKYGWMTLKINTAKNLQKSAIGFKGHDSQLYGALMKNKELLVPFRTWRNSITGKAAAELTNLFDFNIPRYIALSLS